MVPDSNEIPLTVISGFEVLAQFDILVFKMLKTWQTDIIRGSYGPDASSIGSGLVQHTISHHISIVFCCESKLFLTCFRHIITCDIH